MLKHEKEKLCVNANWFLPDIPSCLEGKNKYEIASFYLTIKMPLLLRSGVQIAFVVH